MNMFQLAQVETKTDLRVPVRGKLGFEFTRMYWNRWGTRNETISPATYGLNMGVNWSHNLNLLLYASDTAFTGAGFACPAVLVLWDEIGNWHGYMADYLSTPVNGEATYLPLDAKNGQLRDKIKAYPDGTFVFFATNGTEWHFFPRGTDGVSRLYFISDGLKDAQGNCVNRLTMTYDAQGRLDRVVFPDGDGRYAQFSYAFAPAPNLITRVAVLDADGTQLTKVDYDYAQATYNYTGYSLSTYELHTVTDRTGNQESYRYGTDTNPTRLVPNSHYIASHTDEAGNVFTYTYDYVPCSLGRLGPVRRGPDGTGRTRQALSTGAGSGRRGGPDRREARRRARQEQLRACGRNRAQLQYRVVLDLRPEHQSPTYVAWGNQYTVAPDGPLGRVRTGRYNRPAGPTRTGTWW